MDFKYRVELKIGENGREFAINALTECSSIVELNYSEFCVTFVIEGSTPSNLKLFVSNFLEISHAFPNHLKTLDFAEEYDGISTKDVYINTNYILDNVSKFSKAISIDIISEDEEEDVEELEEDKSTDFLNFLNFLIPSWW